MPGQVSNDQPRDGGLEGRPVERKAPGRGSARGTAAMDPTTRKEVARKGGIAVSRNKEHMAEIGRKGGQTVSKNREHMASIGRKGGEASRGSR
jgi:general stress protein YciG